MVIKNNYHIIAAESSTSDILGNIYGGYLGQILVIQPDAGDTITVQEGGSAPGSMQLSSTPWAMSGDDKLVLIFTGTEWNEISRSDN